MNTFTLYRADERQTFLHHWGTVAETLYGGEVEKFLGFGDLVQLSRMTFNPGFSGTPMKLVRNLELIDIILCGQAGYQDGTGSNASYPENTVYVVSAGKGVYRSEFNASSGNTLEKLQIGILPQKINYDPVRTKALFDLSKHRNSFVTLVSPHVDASSLSIRQQAAVLLGEFDAGEQIIYDVSGGSTGLFLFTIEGIATVGDQIIKKNEALALEKPERIGVTFADESVLLLMELHMSNQETE